MVGHTTASLHIEFTGPHKLIKCKVAGDFLLCSEHVLVSHDYLCSCCGLQAIENILPTVTYMYDELMHELY